MTTIDTKANWHQWLTFNCNFTCEYCIMDERGYRHLPKSLSGKEILNFWNNIAHPHHKRLSIIGGEPTLHKDFAEIINNLEGYYITVTTNCSTPFFRDDSFVDSLNTKPSSHLRMNTSFHPNQKITPEEYKRVVRLMRQAGVHVDQVSFVATPETNQYADKLLEINKEFPLRADVFLGFWNKEDGFDAVKEPQNFWPHEKVPSALQGFQDIKNFDIYREACAQSSKRSVASCPATQQNIMVAPDGNIFHCHYKLYHGIDPVCNINDFETGAFEESGCSHYGYCLSCDATQLQKEIKPSPVLVNKLYDKKDTAQREVKYLGEELEIIAKTKKDRFNSKILFESACAFLYSGHNHHGNVLYVGESGHPLLRYLVRKNYRVTAHTTKGDLKNSPRVKDCSLLALSDEPGDDDYLKNTFDLVLVSESLQHLDNEAEALLTLGSYLKRGGVMVISADFNNAHEKTAENRVYTPAGFVKKIVKPLEKGGFNRQGASDYSNIECDDPDSRPDGSNNSFGVLCVRRTPRLEVL